MNEKVSENEGSVRSPFLCPQYASRYRPLTVRARVVMLHERGGVPKCAKLPILYKLDAGQATGNTGAAAGLRSQPRWKRQKYADSDQSVDVVRLVGDNGRSG